MRNNLVDLLIMLFPTIGTEHRDQFTDDVPADRNPEYLFINVLALQY